MRRRSTLLLLILALVLPLASVLPSHAQTPITMSWAGHAQAETDVVESFCFSGEITEKTDTFHYDFGDAKVSVFAQSVTHFADGTWKGKTLVDGELTGKSYIDFIADWRDYETVSIEATLEIFLPGAHEPTYYTSTHRCSTATAKWAGHTQDQKTIVTPYCYNEIDNDISEKTATFEYYFPEQYDVFANLTIRYEDGTWYGKTYEDGKLSGKGYIDLIGDWRSDKTTSIEAIVEISGPSDHEVTTFRRAWVCMKHMYYAPFVAAGGVISTAMITTTDALSTTNTMTPTTDLSSTTTITTTN